MPFEFPKPPKLPAFPDPFAPVRDVMASARSMVTDAVDGVRSVTNSARPGILPQPGIIPKPTPRAVPGIKPASSEVKAGTACNLCSSEHFAQVAGDLAEAMRFARTEGLNSIEVIRRVSHARQELNEMERYDLASEQIIKLQPADKVLAEWAVVHSRNIRHQINQAITSKKVADLELAAAQADKIAADFLTKLWAMPTEQRKCAKCAQIEDLKHYLQQKQTTKENNPG